jgi:hypothetical protein
MPNQLKTTNSPPLRCNVPGLGFKDTGLQWPHRIILEPRPLLKRYTVNNSLPLYHIALQLTGIRRCEPRIPLSPSSCITSSETQSRSCQ